METINLLNFLNNAKDLYTLDYATCGSNLLNFLNILTEDEQFTQKIDLGIIYVHKRTIDQFTIVDGFGRLLSLSLLLHAVCECYKKTSSRNDEAIKTIKNKYLYSGSRTKLRMPEKYQIVYDKILSGERLSGNEKETEMFQLLHRFWVQIKEEKLQAANIFKMLEKVFVTMVNTDKVPHRDLYFTLNKDKRKINQLLLVENYLKNIGISHKWDALKEILSTSDLELFFRDFFVTKFNFKEYLPERLYELFVNYFETMLQYMSEDTLMTRILRSARLYRNILNVDITNEVIRKALIKIKMHGGEDTYAYILNIYEDYEDNNISEATFLEILLTIDEYLKKRAITPNNVTFNELINYLNAFITCK